MYYRSSTETGIGNTPITTKEIGIYNFNPSKMLSPGVDGFNGKFFQTFKKLTCVYVSSSTYKENKEAHFLNLWTKPALP